MGIFEGAIIGGIAGGLAGGVVAWNLVRWQKAFLAAIDRGDERAARRLLEKHCPELPAGEVPLRALLPQRHRLLGAWLLGDLAAVRAQLGRHRGSAAYLANVAAYGQAVLAVEAPTEAAPAAAEQVRATAAAVRTESTKLQKLLRDRTDLLARVVDGLVTGSPAPSQDDLHAMVGAAGREPLLSRVLWFRLLASGADRRGAPNPRMHALVASMTRRFGAGA